MCNNLLCLRRMVTLQFENWPIATHRGSEGAEVVVEEEESPTAELFPERDGRVLVAVDKPVSPHTLGTAGTTTSRRRRRRSLHRTTFPWISGQLRG